MTITFLARPLLAGLTASVCAVTYAQDPVRVGEQTAGGTVVSTGQIVRPAGDTVAFAGRPVDLAVSQDGTTVYVKANNGLLVIDAASWKVRKQLNFPKGGASMHGIAVSADGAEVYLTSARNEIFVAKVDGVGGAEWSRTLALTGPKGTTADDDPAHLTGIAISADGARAYVCASRNNTLAVVDLRAPDAAAALSRHIPVGIAPFDVVLSPDGNTAYVSDWGGRRPKAGERTGDSSGTQVLVDERGIGASGAISVVDLVSGKETRLIESVGLHPSDLVLSRDGKTLYVANANSDTVSVIDLSSKDQTRTVNVKPDPALPFGSAPNALALDDERGLLYVANGGNNAVAVIPTRGEKAFQAAGFIPAGWYPGALALTSDRLYIANVKGEGSRTVEEKDKGWNVHWSRGTVQRVTAPIDAPTLAAYTEQAHRDGHTPHVLTMLERSTATGVAPVPVPAKLGEPSVFEHVVYIIKENRTYDQVFGDLTRGNADPRLCIYPREITPNHHALAEEFALLDNYYCNGVLSADGHSWATEGYVTDHLEKSFGGFTRSYTFGDDALTYSSSGFIWDRVLAAGLSLRNYGEMDYAEPPKGTTFKQIYDDFVSGANTIKFEQKIGLPRIAQYSARDFPGWNMDIPDVLRASVFLKELEGFEKSGLFPNFVIVYLPNDHTSGLDEGSPTPNAHVADNDLALGRIIEGISKSRFWPKTCIFVNEDDPQDGFDHVDGHRSLCLVVSPYTKRGAVVSKFYNQTSVLHTMSRILGLPPMNQIDAASPLMTDCFTKTVDLAPYTARKNNVPLDQLNPPKTALRGEALHWAKKSEQQDFAKIDAADEDTLNRILWFAAKGPDAPYPARLAGAHGRGLKGLNLALSGERDPDDD